MTSADLPDSYRRTLRILLKYAIVMAILGLLIGVSYQESSKKLTLADTAAGFHLEAVIHLALVHGHVFTIGVLLPLAMAGTLLIARRAGGGEVSGHGLAWLVRGFLPLAAVSLALQLYKGYHILLMARSGERDLAVIDHAFMGGAHALRYGIYAVVHTGMGVSLGVFLVLLWRSLRTTESA